MIKIPYEKAEEMLITFIRECDSDTLSCVFGDTFGYDVRVNQETEELECTPNGLCGFILEQKEENNVTPSIHQHRT